MPSKVLIHYKEHRPVGDPMTGWMQYLPRDKWLGHADHFRDVAEMLRLPYTDEVAAWPDFYPAACHLEAHSASRWQAV